MNDNGRKLALGSQVFRFTVADDDPGTVIATLIDVNTSVSYTIEVPVEAFATCELTQVNVYEHLMQFIEPHVTAHVVAVQETITSGIARVAYIGGVLDGAEKTVHVDPDRRGIPPDRFGDETSGEIYYRDTCTGPDGVWRYRVGELAGQPVHVTLAGEGW